MAPAVRAAAGRSPVISQMEVCCARDCSSGGRAQLLTQGPLCRASRDRGRRPRRVGGRDYAQPHRFWPGDEKGHAAHGVGEEPAQHHVRRPEPVHETGGDHRPREAASGDDTHDQAETGAS